MYGLDLRTKPKVLWIEDDLRFVAQIMPLLRDRYEITHWSSMDDFREDLFAYQAALVDLSFITESFGEAFIELLQKKGFAGAIIVLSADESIQTKIRLLSLGVHDYLWKTMTTEELLIRFSNAIRQAAEKSNFFYQLSGLSVDLITQKVFLNSEAISLTRSEFRLLVQLMKALGLRCHFSKMCDIVWGQTFVDRGAQDTLIWKLNKKLHAWSYRIRREGDIFELCLKEPGQKSQRSSFFERLMAKISTYP